MILVKLLVLATSSLALELSHCQKVEFEVSGDSPGLLYTNPNGSK